MAHRFGHARGQLGRGARWPAWSESCTHSSSARTSSGRSSDAVRADVALDAAQHAERRELLVRGGDLLGLAAQRVGVETGDDGRRSVCGRRSRGTRSRARGPRAHLEHARLPVRPGRVAVQVAADRRRARRAAARPANAPSRSSGGTNGSPSAAKTPSSSGASGSGSSAATHSASRSRGRAPSRTPRAARRTSSIVTPSTVTPTSGRQRDDLRQRREAPARRRPHRRADGDREPVRSVDAAPRVAARDSAQRVGDALGDAPRACGRRSGRAVTVAGRASRFEDPRLGLRPDTGRLPQPSGRCRRAKLVDRRDAERLPDLGQPRWRRCPSRRP